MTQEIVERTVRELRDEADIDFLNLSMIAEFVREDLSLQDQHDIRRHTLNIVECLMRRGVYPGDYGHGNTLAFWPGEPSEHLQRIEAEWITMGKVPTLAEPICWLGLKPGADFWRAP